MKIIWKYQLELTESQIVQIPASAEILSVQVQHGVPSIWALVDPSEALSPRRLLINGTGHAVNPKLARRGFIGTFQLEAGAFVFHVFEADI